MSRIEREIVLLLSELREAHLKDLAQRLGLGIRPLVGHMLNLRKKGYIARHHGGSYILTEKGGSLVRDLLVARERASRILAEVPFERGFHFYRGLGQYTGLTALSLEDFQKALKNLEIASLEFHLSRGDFEPWIRSLGDEDLAERISKIREEGLKGEEALKALSKAVEARIRELKEAIG
jgi:DNA-binding MarR family transcriptional regulator